MNFLAHPENAVGHPHLLQDHLRSVGALARRFAATASPLLVEPAQWAGRLHDLGKYREEFQAYLRAERESSIDTHHAMYGAALAFQRRWPGLAFAIAGHHAGLHDLSQLQALVSEVGVDITRWPTSKHFASWLGLCPGNKISGGKRLSSRSRPTANRAAAALRLAAQSLSHSYSALGGYYHRMKARLGAPKAITATAHKLARVIYSMLRYGTPYVDVGQAAYEQQYRDRVVRNLKRKAQGFGFVLVPIAERPIDPVPVVR